MIIQSMLLASET